MTNTGTITDEDCENEDLNKPKLQGYCMYKGEKYSPGAKVYISDDDYQICCEDGTWS